MTKAVEIRADLIRDAMEATGAATEREAVEPILASCDAEHRKREPRKSMLGLVGEVRLRDDYDHKALRAGDPQPRHKHADLLALVGKVRFRDGYDPRALSFSGHDRIDQSSMHSSNIDIGQHAPLAKLDTGRVAQLIQELFRITDELSEMTGRRFTPDGHLVGSIGEVLAATAYGLVLTPHSTRACDATKDGRKVEIKTTFGKKVAFRAHDGSADASRILVLRLQRAAAFEEIYNGPAAPVLKKLSLLFLGSNGQREISLRQLMGLNAQVAATDRLPRAAREPA
jgi:hypothetical protein